MPTITRWFNVSHDINADPEMWELRETFGDRAGFVWLECLSIADRNSGKIGPNNQHLWRILATKCRLRANKVATIMELCANKGWTKLDDGGCLHVAKWAKYNKTRVANNSPSYPNHPNLPNHTTLKTPIAPKGGESIDTGFEKFWTNYPRKVGKGAAYRAWCKEAKLCSAVQEQIFAALGWQKNQEQWTKERGRFIPHPATWLNQRRWLDEKADQPERQLSERTLRILKRGL